LATLQSLLFVPSQTVGSNFGLMCLHATMVYAARWPTEMSMSGVTVPPAVSERVHSRNMVVLQQLEALYLMP
jgi:hypothetical protein